MAARPLALPETFTGEGRQSFSDWVDHFESIAKVNTWNADAKKNWIRARLTGRAATAWKRLTEDDKDTYDHIVAVLKRRFEPECRKEVFMAEFQRRRKRHAEDWASFGEDLRTLVEKAYPMLQVEAQELLALNRFLSEIADPQLAFGVRQRTPVTLDAAVAATLELETYLQRSTMQVTVAGIEDLGDDVVAVTSRSRSTEDTLQEILRRMERLERRLQEQKRQGTGVEHTPKKDSVVCWNCRQEGHVRRECPTKTRRVVAETGVIGTVDVAGPTSTGRQRSTTVGAVSVAAGGITGETDSSAVFHGVVDGTNVKCLVDTGAPATIMSSDVWDRVNVGAWQLDAVSDQKLVGVQGCPVELIGSTQIDLKFGGKVYPTAVLVAKVVTADIILGRDFLQRNGCRIDFTGRMKLHFPREKTFLTATGASSIRTQRHSRPRRRWRRRTKKRRTQKALSPGDLDVHATAVNAETHDEMRAEDLPMSSSDGVLREATLRRVGTKKPPDRGAGCENRIRDELLKGGSDVMNLQNTSEPFENTCV